ncbi:MAG: hypothetical protein KA766_09775 [Piscinibacter sp.]|uniref:hypothetical protein n=1 Tax=Piscinibacter sp. TaxID=1903157 RepID=UPI001B59FE27|nr:hypothetical protein [Piscinibacter sp.]MBP5990286.1 hypothetical protein [Piscinibacter sp.]MBP6027678.1 hypothetical protein [Piscinibacter sp.]
MNITPNNRRLAPIAAATALLALLAACGGGGGDAGAPANGVTQTEAQSMSANSAVLPADSVEGQASILSTTRAVVAAGSASTTVNCPGGGTAQFTVTGGNALGNGQLDAGEIYSVTYTNCTGAAGAATLNGSATLTVVTASGGTTQVNTATQNLQIALPLRTLTVNGSSTLTETVADNGGGVIVTTHRWTSPQIVLTSVRNARTSTFTLSNVDQTRAVTTTNGVISARSRSGTITIDAQLPNGSWTVTTATQGAVSYDANGVPTQGAWTITLPHNIIGISVVPGTLTVTVDWGADGTIDRTWTFTNAQVGSEAG